MKRSRIYLSAAVSALAIVACQSPATNVADGRDKQIVEDERNRTEPKREAREKDGVIVTGQLAANSPDGARPVESFARIAPMAY
jgi:hypothetical protein